jgi:hypothetical protein
MNASSRSQNAIPLATPPDPFMATHLGQCFANPCSDLKMPSANPLPKRVQALSASSSRPNGLYRTRSYDAVVLKRK